MPLLLTNLYTSMIIKFLPFIIFLSSMWFMLRIRNNKDLLTQSVWVFNLKVLTMHLHLQLLF